MIMVTLLLVTGVMAFYCDSRTIPRIVIKIKAIPACNQEPLSPPENFDLLSPPSLTINRLPREPLVEIRGPSLPLEKSVESVQPVPDEMLVEPDKKNPMGYHPPPLL